MKETRVWSLDQKDSLEEEVATHSVFLPGEFHGQRSLAAYSPWVCKESDMTEWLTLPLYLFFCVIIFVFVMLFICYDSFTCVFIVFIIFGKVLAIISLNSYLVLYSRDSNYTYFNCLMLFYSPFIFIFLSLSFFFLGFISDNFIFKFMWHFFKT